MADHDLPPLLGESPAFMALTEQISRVAPLDRPVLVIGERGTGKELVAARLHFLSRRWGGPFVKLNCAALAESLRSEEHTSELQSLMRLSYAVFCLKKKTYNDNLMIYT